MRIIYAASAFDVVIIVGFSQNVTLLDRKREGIPVQLSTDGDRRQGLIT